MTISIFSQSSVTIAPRLGRCVQTLQSGRPYFVPAMQLR
jgi:hypothetical protein